MDGVEARQNEQADKLGKQHTKLAVTGEKVDTISKAVDTGFIKVEQGFVRIEDALTKRADNEREDRKWLWGKVFASITAFITAFTAIGGGTYYALDKPQATPVPISAPAPTPAPDGE